MPKYLVPVQSRVHVAAETSATQRFLPWKVYEDVHLLVTDLRSEIQADDSRDQNAFQFHGRDTWWKNMESIHLHKYNMT